MTRKTIHLIAAARPNFMKVAPLYHALAATDWADPQIVHTGQHYDFNMSDAFFADLNLPEPSHHLGVGSGSHAQQTGGVMIAYEAVCMEKRPDCVIVVGDVNSTVACGMVAAKLWIPCVHLEAGLRSRDRSMPEEVNRLATDAIADLLWTPSPDGDENLANEGHPPERYERIGNIMIDSFEMLRDKIEASDTRSDLGLDGKDYAVVTLHRPSNVDEVEPLTVLIGELEGIAAKIPVVMVGHPRTINKLKEFNLLNRLESNDRITLLEPLPYISFMNVITGAKIVITDSGGLQEETTYLGISCLTLRPNTERPITITEGTNLLVTPDDVQTHVERVLSGEQQKPASPPDLWDGKTALRARDSLQRFLGG